MTGRKPRRTHASAPEAGQIGLMDGQPVRHLWPWLPVVVALLGACGEKTSEAIETGPRIQDPYANLTTFTDTFPVVIDTIDVPSCDAGGDVWSFGVNTLGWSQGGLLNMWETGVVDGWNEEHTLPSVEFGQYDSWERLERLLTDEASVGTFQPDTNSVFVCGVHDIDSTMTWAIRVMDFDDNSVMCAIFASDPGGIAAVFDGVANTPNPVTDPQQINEADCEDWSSSVFGD